MTRKSHAYSFQYFCGKFLRKRLGMGKEDRFNGSRYIDKEYSFAHRYDIDSRITICAFARTLNSNP